MTVEQTNGSCKISGDLTFERAAEVFSAINFSKLSQDRLVIDFSAVDQSDSAALAVMLEWTKQANKNQKQISFNHVPQQLMRLIKMADLQDILKLD